MPGLFRLLQQKGDALVEQLQSRGLHESARLARTALGEAAPVDADGRWADWEVDTLARLMARMCHYAGADLPAPRECGAVEGTREFISTLPAGRRTQIRDLLALLEAASKLTGPEGQYRRFTELGAAAADTYIASWAESALPPRRAVFHGLKSVCMMGYWSREGTWGAIGYDVQTDRSAEQAGTFEQPGTGNGEPGTG